MEGAYGLTEPNSGSDALGAKTTAKLSDDGKYYLLNGKNAGSPMVVLQMCIRYLQKWMEISSQALLWKEELKDLHRDRKNTRWVSKVLQLFNCISRIAKCRLKMC